MGEVSILPRQDRLSETAVEVIHGIRANAVLYIFAAFVFLTAVVESIWIGLPFDIKMVTAFTATVLILLCAMILVGIVAELIRLYWTGHKGSVLGGLWWKISDDYLAPQRLSNSIHAFLLSAGGFREKLSAGTGASAGWKHRNGLPISFPIMQPKPRSAIPARRRIRLYCACRNANRFIYRLCCLEIVTN